MKTFAVGLTSQHRTRFVHGTQTECKHTSMTSPLVNWENTNLDKGNHHLKYLLRT